MITNEQLQEEIALITDDYSEMKKRLTVRLLPWNHSLTIEGNNVFIPIADKELVIMFACEIDEDYEFRTSVIINKDVMKKHGLDLATLYKDAMDNAARLHKVVIETLDIMIHTELVVPELTVVTTDDYFKGAYAILYPSTLEVLEERIGPNFYIIPSSIHEVIVCPGFDGLTPNDLLEIIADVNRTVVSEEDFLSNKLFQYDSARKQIVLVKEMES